MPASSPPPYLVHVVEVAPVGAHLIRVVFDDGKRGVFDMAPYLSRGVFQALNDPQLFSEVRVALGTAAWPNGIDVAPERLWTDCAPE